MGDRTGKYKEPYWRPTQVW